MYLVKNYQPIHQILCTKAHALKYCYLKKILKESTIRKIFK